MDTNPTKAITYELNILIKLDEHDFFDKTYCDDVKFHHDGNRITFQ